MADEFDAIILGAGHNGLVLANYLVRCGLSVLCLERKLEAGGGLLTEELTVPGYWNNTLSYFFDELSIEPAFSDLDLDGFGVRLIQPDAVAALARRDGRALVFHSDSAATARSIARFS